MGNLLKILILFFVALLQLNASSWYVRTNAVGGATGLNWNNAWSAQGITWGSVAAGDTIYLAGGTYTNAMLPTASGTSGSRIVIQRVRSTDSTATAAAGWDSSFDAQVLFSNPNDVTSTFVGVKWAGGSFGGSYMTIDGRITNGWKFQVTDQADPNSWSAALMVWLVTPASDLIFTNLEFATVKNATNGYPFTNASTGIYIQSGQTYTNCLISHCSFHDMVQAIQLGSSTVNWTVQKCEIANTYPLVRSATPGDIQHDNVVWLREATNFIFRFNRARNWATEGLLITAVTNEQNNGVKIYGNIFQDGATGSARGIETQTDSGLVEVYNNTWVNINSFTIRDFIGTTSWAVSNNICYNTGDMQPVNRDYNLFSGANSGTTTEAHAQLNAASSIFANYSGKDFSLSGTGGAVNNGATLATAYNSDFAGNTRTVPWDIGAYEYFFANTITNNHIFNGKFGTIKY